MKSGWKFVCIIGMVFNYWLWHKKSVELAVVRSTKRGPSMPTKVEQTTLEPTLIWKPPKWEYFDVCTSRLYIVMAIHKISHGWIITPRGIYRCYVQDFGLEVARFRFVSNTALVNAFNMSGQKRFFVYKTKEMSLLSVCKDI